MLERTVHHDGVVLEVHLHYFPLLAVHHHRVPRNDSRPMPPHGARLGREREHGTIHDDREAGVQQCADDEPFHEVLPLRAGSPWW
jgi:hypothetical protein